jgi:hypothetical protein
MYSTQELLAALRQANPERLVTEDLIRRTIRQGLVAPPDQVAGRYIWKSDDIRLLSEALELREPIWSEVDDVVR